MQDITPKAMDILMSRAPVWAASMAGRTKVFTDANEPTAYVTGGGGRFKVVINESIANSPDLEFVLMHEVAHVFRRDLYSMQRHQQIAPQINVAADCIINDSLVKMGLAVSKELRKNGCFGKDIYKKDCSGLSINDLIEIKVSEDATEKASKPSSATPEGEDMLEQEADKPGGSSDEHHEQEDNDHTEHKWGANPEGYIGLGGGEVWGDATSLAKSLVSYAKRMFFEQGFKSKNMSTKYDWRRNRSSFAYTNEIVIPRTTTGEYGHNLSGPLVNLVLDTSGSMDRSWVATAATIAKEIDKSGLDYDLWLTPSRRKAKSRKKLIEALINGEKSDQYLHPMSHPNLSHWGGGEISPDVFKATKNVPSNRKVHPRASSQGADELDALGLFETEDPVVWIYIGDYWSQMRMSFQFERNFLHVPMINGDSNIHAGVMRELGLPRWNYEVKQ